MARLPILIFIFTFTFEFSGNSQNPFDSRIENRVSCEDVFYSAFYLIPKYYENSELDSIRQFLNYWEDKCGPNNFSKQVRTLFELEKGVFNSKSVDYELFQHLIGAVGYVEYLSMMDSMKLSYSSMPHETREELALSYEFFVFTSVWATDLLDKYESCTDEHLILLVYASDFDSFFNTLKEGKCTSSVISQFYNEEVQTYLNKSEGDLGLIVGMWNPLGNARILGIHPSLGFYLGLQDGRLLWDLTMLFRFIKSPEPYLVVHDGAPLETTHFLGGYIGLDVGYQLLNTPNSNYFLVGGMGFDGFDAFKPDPDTDEEPSKSINSLNTNIGLGARWFYNESTYIGLECRYNVVRYNNPGGTDLSGNTLSVRLLFGFTNNFQKRQALNQLRYYD